MNVSSISMQDCVQIEILTINVQITRSATSRVKIVSEVLYVVFLIPTCWVLESKSKYLFCYLEACSFKKRKKYFTESIHEGL